MKTVADENIPYVAEAFSCFGNVKTLPAASITPETLNDADILLVRSVTKVNKTLLENSPVRFVATATIGIDHIDRAYLDEQNIPFASAPGSNANSVSEWVTAALLHLSVSHSVPLRGRTLGVVGVGNVGSRVVKKTEALGLTVLQNDPPRARREGEVGFVSLETLLTKSDIVTMHVPLTKEGADKTLLLADALFFQKMKPGAVFLNSSRGGVVEETALQDALRVKYLAHAVLDVWQTEPNISHETLRAATLGTPHIAGYSFDGKVTGTQMIQHAACENLHVGTPWDPASVLPATDVPQIKLNAAGQPPEAILNTIITKLYSITEDDASLRTILNMDAESAGKHFTKLRKEYPRRREWIHTTVQVNGADESLRHSLRRLGFRIKD